MNPDPKSETLRLPLWKGVLEDLSETALHGQVIEAAWFEDQLKCQRDSMEFGLAVSQIRKGLEHLGMHLSGHGLKGNQFVILLPADNAAVLKIFQKRAVSSLQRAVTLGTTTPLTGLSDSERRIHERETSKAAFRLALMRQPTPKKIGTE